MILYHYCSTDSFLKIIQGGEIWACETSLANDTMEGKWVHRLALEYGKAQNLSAESKGDYLRQFDSYTDDIKALALCLSEQGDMLSQWRGYASDAAGISIGFSKSSLSKLGEKKGASWDLCKVEYNKKKQLKLVGPFFDKIIKALQNGASEADFRSWVKSGPKPSKKDDAGFDMMLAMVMLSFQFMHTFKNPAFKEEKEWRLIKSIPRAKSLKSYKTLKFHSKVDRIIPYLPVKLHDLGPSCIQRVILGPRNITPEHIIQGMLDSFGFIGVPVERSIATYR